MTITCLCGDCREVLKTLPNESVHCIVTSPPYFGLRDYGIAGQIGLEPTSDEYVAQMVAVFHEVRRVLREDGTAWLNLGDSYVGQGLPGWRPGNEDKNNGASNKNGCGYVAGLKPKDLIGIPWRVAFALQADGWWLRQDIIWSKRNPMPESATDRCTKAHEYIFLLSKSAKYYYDAGAIAEPSAYPGDNRAERADLRKAIEPMCIDNGSRNRTGNPTGETRNKRSVWEISTQPFSEAHFATFPPALIEPCILAGCPDKCCVKCGAPHRKIIECDEPMGRKDNGGESDGFVDFGLVRAGTRNKIIIGSIPSCQCNAGTVPGTCLDPFGGAGTTGLVADRLGRDAILIELNEAYADMARNRIEQDAPLFVEFALVPRNGMV
jgi:DNA modification methylase